MFGFKKVKWKKIKKIIPESLFLFTEHNKYQENFNKQKTNNILLDTLFDYNVKHNKIPAFKFHSSQLEIINQPSDFYLSIIVSFIILFFSRNS